MRAFVQCIGHQVKEPDAMLTEGQAGVKEKLFNMGDIWGIYMQKGRIWGRKEWRSKTGRQGYQWNRVLTEVEKISKGKERR